MPHRLSQLSRLAPIRLVALVAPLLPLFVACHVGLPDPPENNGREELTERPLDDERCVDTGMEHVAPPAELLEAGGGCDRHTQAFCFRLHPDLREVAEAADPHAAIERSARSFDRYLASGERLDLAWARACADLAVSGGAAYVRFAQQAPSASDFQGGPSEAAVQLALERAYAVAWALRGPPSHRTNARPALGWVAVSPEDDLPARPVNVPSGAFAQTDLEVDVPLGAERSRRVRTRLLIASTSPPAEPAVPSTLLGSVPPPTPLSLADDGDVMIFLHGHSSLAEEGAGLAAGLLSEYEARGASLTVVLADLPSNGYAERVDPSLVIDAADGSEEAVLDFLDAFVIALVQTLDGARPGLSDRVAAVIGGSLGGNMVLRLAERGDELPWVRRAVAWSPASIDYSWTRAKLAAAGGDEYYDLIKHEAVRLTRRESERAERPRSRRDYFAGGLMSLSTQAGYWYRESWGACRTQLVGEGLRQLGEVYDDRLRRWHYRVAYEQLVFSHLEPAVGGDAPRFTRIAAPLLLVAGEADNGVPMQTWFFAHRLAPHLTMPGRTLFLEDTGHALHSERPAYLASQIAAFVLD